MKTRQSSVIDGVQVSITVETEGTKLDASQAMDLFSHSLFHQHQYDLDEEPK